LMNTFLELSYFFNFKKSRNIPVPPMAYCDDNPLMPILLA